MIRPIETDPTKSWEQSDEKSYLRFATVGASVAYYLATENAVLRGTVELLKSELGKAQERIQYLENEGGFSND